MNELILSLAMLAGMDHLAEALRPQPTKEQLALIEKLGDREWRVRQDADNELRKMGYEALLAVERKGLTSECPEIASRAERIHASYFRVTASNDEVPNCTGLFKLERITLCNGKVIDIKPGTAKKYLMLVAKDEDHQIFYSYYGNEDNEWMLRQATFLFAKDLYRAGYLREEVVEAMNAIMDNQDNWKPYDLRQEEEKIEYSGQFES